MAYNETWVNDDGLEVPFGPWVSDNLDAGTVHTKGKTKEVQMLIDTVEGWPQAGTAHSTKDAFIPNGAYVVSARYIAEVDFDFATDIGTSQKDGTVIDADGLLVGILTTAEGAGALIGTTVTADSYFVVADNAAAGGPATVGRGTLIVEYII